MSSKIRKKCSLSIQDAKTYVKKCTDYGLYFSRRNTSQIKSFSCYVELYGFVSDKCKKQNIYFVVFWSTVRTETLVYLTVHINLRKFSVCQLLQFTTYISQWKLLTFKTHIYHSILELFVHIDVHELRTHRPNSTHRCTCMKKISLSYISQAQVS